MSTSPLPAGPSPAQMAEFFRQASAHFVMVEHLLCIWMRVNGATEGTQIYGLLVDGAIVRARVFPNPAESAAASEKLRAAGLPSARWAPLPEVEFTLKCQLLSLVCVDELRDHARHCPSCVHFAHVQPEKGPVVM